MAKRKKKSAKAPAARTAAKAPAARTAAKAPAAPPAAQTPADKAKDILKDKPGAFAEVMRGEDHRGGDVILYTDGTSFWVEHWYSRGEMVSTEKTSEAEARAAYDKHLTESVYQ